MQPKIIKYLWMIMLLSILSVHASHAQNVQLSAYAQDLSIIFLGDLDLTRTGGGVPVFWLTLQTDQEVQVYLKVTMRSRRYGVFAYGTTKVFLLEAAFPRQIDNTNLFTEGQNYSFEDYDWNQEIADELRDKILATGKLPSDIYQIIIEVFHYPSDQLYDDYVLTLDVTNPTTLDLIYPGAPTDDDDIPIIFTTLPQFHWESNIDLFKLVVAEKKPLDHLHAAPEEVIDDEIRLETFIRVYRGGDALPETTGPDTVVTFATFLQYPPSGVLPLEEGKTYYWQVTGLPATSGTTLELESEIWGFTIGNLSDLLLTPDQIELLAQLRTIIGDDFVDRYLATGGELDGYTPTGRIIGPDGQSLTVEELRLLVAKFLSGELEVLEIIIE